MGRGRLKIIAALIALGALIQILYNAHQGKP